MMICLIEGYEMRKTTYDILVDKHGKAEADWWLGCDKEVVRYYGNKKLLKMLQETGLGNNKIVVEAFILIATHNIFKGE